MKELRILYKVIVGIVGTAWLAVQPAAGQVNGNRYNTNYSDRTIQHKATGTTKNKWFQTREATGMSASAKAMDTFNDEVWSFNVYGHDVQAAHTFTDTLYVHKGRSVTLNLPTVSNGGRPKQCAEIPTMVQLGDGRAFSYGEYRGQASPGFAYPVERNGLPPCKRLPGWTWFVGVKQHYV